MKQKGSGEHGASSKAGISLISLIITIIVIIILAAIVLFNGLSAPDSANFAKFTQQVDNVYMAVMNKYAKLLEKHSIAGESRTQEQIYLEIAEDNDYGQSKYMGTTIGSTKESADTSTGIQNIKAKTNSEHSIGMTLPLVRESNKGWYVTADGRVFNANGYYYEGKTYFSGAVYAEGQLDSADADQHERAEKIWGAIKNDTSVTNITSSITGAGSNTGGEPTPTPTPTITNVTHPGEEPVTGDEVTITLNGHTDNYYYVRDNGSKKVYLAVTSLSGTTSWASSAVWSGRANGSYPYDLNNDVENNSSDYNDPNPYSRAKDFGDDRGVTGRLLTVDEYNTLSTAGNWSSIYPNGGTSWWLGSAYPAFSIHEVTYRDGSLGDSNPRESIAVRPVIEF